MTEQEITLQITALQEIASAASRACIHYMSPETGNTAKYLEALREHTKATSEINKLKKMLNEAES
mgnify:CR=1 FL=1